MPKPKPPYLPGPKTCRALDLHCAGYSLIEIAARLGNSPDTVSTLLRAGARALGLPNANRVVLAVTWSQVSPLIESTQEQEAAATAVAPAPQAAPPQESPPPGPPPIYTLIDPLTRRRRPAPEMPEAPKRHRKRKGRKEPWEPEALPQAAIKALAALDALPQTPGHESSEREPPERLRTLRPARSPLRRVFGPLAAQKRSDVGPQGISRHARSILRQRPRVCERCAYKPFVDVCHIRPVCTFAGDALLGVINAPDNLIYLCPNCHREFDAGLWTLSRPQGCAETATTALGKQIAYTSVYRGVSWDKQKGLWRASIYSQGRRYALGRFREERDAALAYNAAALRLCGEDAKLNPLD